MNYLLKLNLLLLCLKGGVGEIEFGEVTTVSTLVRLFPSQIFENNVVILIQEDESRPGHVLIGTYTSLLSLPLANESTDGLLIAGDLRIFRYAEGIGESAKFKQISGLVQMPEHYIVVDCRNHCLRKIEPIPSDEVDANSQYITSPFAGTCTKSGADDGHRNLAEFYLPWDVTKSNGLLYITERGNKRLRQLDLGTNMVSTIHQSEFYLYSLVLGEKSGEFYVTAPYGVLHITQSQTETWLVGSATNISEPSAGRFSSAGFDFPIALKWLDRKILLVSDHRGNMLKVVDLERKETQEICSGGEGHADGNVLECMLEEPISLLVMKGKIYIGEITLMGGIRELTYYSSEVNGSNPNCTTPPNCTAPQQVTNAEFTPHQSYPIGTEIVYHCKNWYMNKGSNTKLLCSVLDGEKVGWVGETINCELTAQTYVVTALATCCLLLIIALVLTVIKRRQRQRPHSQPERVTFTRMELNKTRTVERPRVAAHLPSSNDTADDDYNDYSVYETPVDVAYSYSEISPKLEVLDSEEDYVGPFMAD